MSGTVIAKAIAVAAHTILITLAFIRLTPPDRESTKIIAPISPPRAPLPFKLERRQQHLNIVVGIVVSHEERTGSTCQQRSRIVWRRGVVLPVGDRIVLPDVMQLGHDFSPPTELRQKHLVELVGRFRI